MKKGQAALEFLTTYGWAFLVILVMIGALAYFGVLNPKGLLPSRCTFGPEVDCFESQSVSNNGNNVPELQFRFRNNVGATADFNFTATYLGGDNPEVDCTSETNGAGTWNITLGPGRTGEVFCTFKPQTVLSKGEKAKFEVKTAYKKSDGSYWQQVTGDIFGSVN